jgi:hypothetical protein
MTMATRKRKSTKGRARKTTRRALPPRDSKGRFRKRKSAKRSRR